MCPERNPFSDPTRTRIPGRFLGSMTEVNFHIYYEIDEDEVKTVLRADEYDGEGEGSWV